MNRRRFLKSTSILAPFLTGLTFSPGLIGMARANETSGWDSGSVDLILPTVSDSEILFKIMLSEPQESPPILQIDNRSIHGDMLDTKGIHWQFHIRDLSPLTTYDISLRSAGGKALCETWPVTTFPANDYMPDNFRLLIFTCAGGHQEMGFLQTAVRKRLLQRGLSFNPDAAIANGDHVYWDLSGPHTSKRQGASELAKQIAGQFDYSENIIGTDNEFVLTAAVAPQIQPVYGTDFRSIPMFFIQDDHDYFENDDATDEIVTFPPSHYMQELARCSQKLFYPEFLPDAARPAGLPGSSRDGLALPISESFGTLRYGRLVELLLYTTRRTQTLAGPSAVVLDPQVERWLMNRMEDREVLHVINVPSNPTGWSAGKWGEWYPDILDGNGELSTRVPKPYWQSGWLAQHDRIITAISNMSGRIPLTMSGDLHAIGMGTIHGTGNFDISANPVITVLNGPIGTSPTGWPSNARGIGPLPSTVLDFEENVPPVEEHGFTIVDFDKTSIRIKLFKWDVNSQSVDDIDNLLPFEDLIFPLSS